MIKARLARTRAISACVMAGAIAIACLSESSQPAEVRVGIYDITTVLDTFSFETPGSELPQDCGPSVDYCTHYRSAGSATLSGTLTYSSSTGRIKYPVDSLGYTLDMLGAFCDTLDNTIGCTHVALPKTVGYPTWTVTNGSSTASLFFSGDNGGFEGDIRHLDLTAMVIAGDSITGRIYWSLTSNRSPPSYRGKFVAKRRP